MAVKCVTNYTDRILLTHPFPVHRSTTAAAEACAVNGRTDSLGSDPECFFKIFHLVQFFPGEQFHLYFDGIEIL